MATPPIEVELCRSRRSIRDCRSSKTGSCSSRCKLRVAASGRRREWNQVREARRLREQQSRPFVVIDFDIESNVQARTPRAAAITFAVPSIRVRRPPQWRPDVARDSRVEEGSGASWNRQTSPQCGGERRGAEDPDDEERESARQALRGAFLVLHVGGELHRFDRQLELRAVDRREDELDGIGDQFAVGRAQPGGKPQRLELGVGEQFLGDLLGVGIGLPKRGRQIEAQEDWAQGLAALDEAGDLFVTFAHEIKCSSPSKGW